MIRLRYIALGALLVFALAGCTSSSSTGSNATVAIPTSGAEGTTEATSEAPTSAATAAETASEPTEPAATAISGTPAPPSGEIQHEQITLNSEGLLEPSTISTTVGMTLALSLDNQSQGDVLLVFDLNPAGAFGVTLRSTAVVTDMATPIATTSLPTSTGALTATAPLLPPTSSATGALTDTTSTTDTTPAETAETAEPTAEVTSTATLPPTSSAQIVYLRFDQPGSYQVHCAFPETAPGQAGCSGSVTITVQAAAPGETPEATSAIPELTATPELTGTTSMTSTAEMTGTTSTTSTTEMTTTAEPAATSESSATSAPATSETTPAATSETGTTPEMTATP